MARQLKFDSNDVSFCQLLELQHRIGNDSRFQLNSRFFETGDADSRLISDPGEQCLSSRTNWTCFHSSVFSVVNLPTFYNVCMLACKLSLIRRRQPDKYYMEIEKTQLIGNTHKHAHAMAYQYIQ